MKIYLYCLILLLYMFPRLGLTSQSEMDERIAHKPIIVPPADPTDSIPPKKQVAISKSKAKKKPSLTRYFQTYVYDIYDEIPVFRAEIKKKDTNKVTHFQVNFHKNGKIKEWFKYLNSGLFEEWVKFYYSENKTAHLIKVVYYDMWAKPFRIVKYNWKQTKIGSQLEKVSSYSIIAASEQVFLHESLDEKLIAIKDQEGIYYYNPEGYLTLDELWIKGEKWKSRKYYYNERWQVVMIEHYENELLIYYVRKYPASKDKIRLQQKFDPEGNIMLVNN